MEKPTARKATPARTAAIAAARALDGTKGENVVVLDVSDVSPITEFLVIATGDNPRHVKALAEDTIRALREVGVPPLSRDGLDQGTWGLVDYGALMVHVFRREQREFYDLDMLWGDGKKVRWQPPVRKAAAKAAAKPKPKGGGGKA